MKDRADKHAGVSYDEGLRSYFIGIFNRMGLGLLITALVAFTLPVVVPGIEAAIGGGTFFWVWIAAVVVELILVFLIAGKALTGSYSASKATGMFYIYAALNGFTLLPILFHYTAASAALAFLSAASVFAGAALYGYTTKKDITGWGNLLFMALIGLIVAMVLNIFIGSGMMDMVISAAAVLLFTALTACDMQTLKLFYYEEGEGNPERAGQLAAYGALSLYLDFINLFVHLLRLIGVSRD